MALSLGFERWVRSLAYRGGVRPAGHSGAPLESSRTSVALRPSHPLRLLVRMTGEMYKPLQGCEIERKGEEFFIAVRLCSRTHDRSASEEGRDSVMRSSALGVRPPRQGLPAGAVHPTTTSRIVETDRVGFEPTERFPVHALSRRVPSAARPPVRNTLNG